MNSQQIAYFLEVVRQGSFTKAAQVLHTSQPSVKPSDRAAGR
ncbi:MAG: LysR family transcriptional regulator [Coprococcus sp.]